MSSVQDRAREDARYRILRLIEEKPSISQRELSQHVGISVGAINYVLKAFVDKGLVKLGNFSASKQKHRYAYILTPKGIAEKSSLTRRFLERKVAEYEALRGELSEKEGITFRKKRIRKRRSRNERSLHHFARLRAALGGSGSF